MIYICRFIISNNIAFLHTCLGMSVYFFEVIQPPAWITVTAMLISLCTHNLISLICSAMRKTCASHCWNRFVVILFSWCQVNVHVFTIFCLHLVCWFVPTRFLFFPVVTRTLVFFSANMFGRVLLPCREEWIWWHFNGIQLSMLSLRCFPEYTNVYYIAMSIFQHVGLHVWRFQLPSSSFEGDSNRWDLGVSGWEASVRSLSLIIMGDTWRMNVMWHHSKFDGLIVWGFEDSFAVCSHQIESWSNLTISSVFVDIKLVK